MIQETSIILAGGFVCAAIGYLACTCMVQIKIRRIEVETWRAAKIFYARKAFEHISRRG